MRRDTALLAAAVFLAGVPLVAGAAGAAPSAVGGTAPSAEVVFVYEYNGPDRAYAIAHNGIAEKIAPLLLLYPGDRVSVVESTNALKSGARNYVGLDVGGRPVKVEPANSPYCIGVPDGDCSKHPLPTSQAPSGAAVLLGNMFAGLRSVFHVAHEDYYAEQTESMLPRGSGAGAPIRIPLLEGKTQRLAVGNRTLEVTWRGGKPPYDVMLIHGDDTAPIARTQTETTRAAFEPIALRAGGYRIRIVDRDSNDATASFIVVAGDAVPTPTQEEQTALGDPALSPALRATLAAALLAERDATWRFEAYERVAPLASDCPPAELLRYRLAEGDD